MIAFLIHIAKQLYFVIQSGVISMRISMKLLLVGACLIGYILVMISHNHTFATQTALLIALILNAIIIFNKQLSSLKENTRFLSASFLFGTFLGVITGV